MKRISFIVLAIGMIALTSCDPNAGLANPRTPNVSVSGGVNSWGQVWIQANVNTGFGGGYYYPTFYPNNTLNINTFVLWVPRAPGGMDIDVPVFLQNGQIAFDPMTGSQIGSAQCLTGRAKLYLMNYNYIANGYAPVMVQREAVPTAMGPNGVPIYKYTIL